MNFLERHIASYIHKEGLKSSRLLLAVSGGRDSMTLWHAMKQIASDFHIELHIAHFHHGQTDQTPQVLQFRDEVFDWIQEKALQESIPFSVEMHQGKPLHSEDLLRKARWSFLKRMCLDKQCKAIVTAHHLNDLLETRLLRLIRGVGPQGIQAMTVYDGQVFRPFLDLFQKDILEAYQHIEYKEDPSNTSFQVLRNWLRHQWLPDLEKQVPGAVKVFSRSLALLSQKREQIKTEDFFDEQGINRLAFESLARVDQQQVIASYLRWQNLKNYTSSHVFEVQKRLKTPQKNFEFWLLKHRWVVTPTHITLSKKSSL